MHEIILKLKQTKYNEIIKDLNESHTRMKHDAKIFKAMHGVEIEILKQN
jgi:hypothetical protein